MLTTPPSFSFLTRTHMRAHRYRRGHTETHTRTAAMPTHTKKVRNSNEEDVELRKGPWTLEEDSTLIHHITCHGEGRWNLLAKFAGKQNHHSIE